MSSPIVTISETQVKVPSININGCQGESSKKGRDYSSNLKISYYETNLKKPSIEDPDYKVSIKDLRSALSSAKPFISPVVTAISSSPTTSPANSSPRTMSPVVSSSITTATVSFINSPRSSRKTPRSPLATSLSPPSSPSLSLSQNSPRATSILGPISRFTFGESSSGTSIDAQTGCSPESSQIDVQRRNYNSPTGSRSSPSPKMIRKENSPSVENENPGRSSPLTQRAFKQLRWCSTSKKSSGSFIGRRKLSREDSMMTTLMTSLDQVPELGGHLDMDSTSCSLCSSGDDDPPSLPRGQSPSLFPRAPPTTNTPSDSDAAPPNPSSPVLVQNDDDDDDTLGSNSDYTIEGELDDQDEFLPSPSDPSAKHRPELQLSENYNNPASELPIPCDNPSIYEASLLLTTNNPCQSDSFNCHRTCVQNSESSKLSSTSAVTPSLKQDLESVGTSHDRNECFRESVSLTEPETANQYSSLPDQYQDNSILSEIRSPGDNATTINSEYNSLSLPPRVSEVLESQLLSMKCQCPEEESNLGHSSESRASLSVKPKGNNEQNKNSLPDS